MRPTRPRRRYELALLSKCPSIRLRWLSAWQRERPVVATVATPTPARARLAFTSRSAFLRLGATSSFQLYITIPVNLVFERKIKSKKKRRPQLLFKNEKAFAPKTAPMEPRGNSNRASAVAAYPILEYCVKKLRVKLDLRQVSLLISETRTCINRQVSNSAGPRTN